MIFNISQKIPYITTTFIGAGMSWRPHLRLGGSRPDQIPFTKLTCDYFLLNCLSMLAANSSGFRSPAKRD